MRSRERKRGRGQTSNEGEGDGVEEGLFESGSRHVHVEDGQAKESNGSHEAGINKNSKDKGEEGE